MDDRRDALPSVIPWGLTASGTQDPMRRTHLAAASLLILTTAACYSEPQAYRLQCRAEIIPADVTYSVNGDTATLRNNASGESSAIKRIGAAPDPSLPLLGTWDGGTVQSDAADDRDHGLQSQFTLRFTRDTLTVTTRCSSKHGELDAEASASIEITETKLRVLLGDSDSNERIFTINAQSSSASQLATPSENPALLRTVLPTGAGAASFARSLGAE